MNIFEQTPPNRRRYGLAAFIGLIAGVVSAFVEVGLKFHCRHVARWICLAAWPGIIIRLQAKLIARVIFSIHRIFFFETGWGLTDPNAAVYTFGGHVFNCWHAIIFSIVFAVGYCVVAEVFPKIKLWQGLLAGALAQLFVHMISFLLMGLTPLCLISRGMRMFLKFLDI